MREGERVSSDLGIIHTCWIAIYRMKNLVREPFTWKRKETILMPFSLSYFSILICLKKRKIYYFLLRLIISLYTTSMLRIYIILAIELLSDSGSSNLLIIIILWLSKCNCYYRRWWGRRMLPRYQGQRHCPPDWTKVTLRSEMGKKSSHFPENCRWNISHLFKIEADQIVLCCESKPKSATGGPFAIGARSPQKPNS